MYRRGTNLEYRIFGPTNYTVDVCGSLEHTWSNIIMEIILKNLKKLSDEENVLHPCPFSV